MLSLDNSVGLNVEITTTLDSKLTGTIHSYNPHSGLLSIIKSPSTDGNNNSGKVKYITIKTTFIKHIISLTSKKPNNNNGGKPIQMSDRFSIQQNKPYPISINSLNKSNAIENSKLKNSYYLNKNLNYLHKKKISLEGLEIFKKLFNLLPLGDVNFDSKNDNILVFDNHLIITKPYKVENCKLINSNEKNGGKGGDQDQQLSYIKKVIKEVWNKLENERKGG